MRIAIISQNYFQPNNGQATFVRHLAEGLAANAHTVQVLAPSVRGPHSRDVVAGVTRIGITSTALPFYSDVRVTYRADREVAQRLAELHPDIVHLQDHFPLCRAALRASEASGLRLVGTNHFLPENLVPFIPVLSRFAPTRALAANVMWRGVRRVFDRLQAATAPTETAAAILRAHVHRTSVRPISCGVNTEVYRPLERFDRTSARARLRIPDDKPVVLFVGRVDREKRVDVLLRALALPGCDGAHCVIAGRGRDRTNYQRLASSLGIADRVLFPGYVAPEDKVPLLNCVDLFAMPSEAELQSIATLEAMACGRPVLASDARALPELVTTGENGALFRSGDAADAARALAGLLAEPAQWPAMGAESLRRAQAHALPNTIRAYEELYYEALTSEPSETAQIPRGTANPPGRAPRIT